MDVAQGEGKSGLPRSHTDVKFSKINFNPDFLFAVGSPIAGVLIIRGQSFHEYRIRTKTKFFNLFHLYDPMAYRLEPLLDDKYIEMSPVLLERPTSKSTFSQLSYYREQLQSYLSSTQLPSLALPAFTLPALSSLTLAKESLNRQFATMIDSVSSVGLPSIFSAPKDVPKTTAHKRKHSETEEPMQGTPRKSPRLAKTRLVKHPVSHKHYNEKDGKILLSKTQVVSSPPNASVEMTRKTSSSPITTQLLAGVSAVNESFTSIIEKVVKKIKINRSEKEQGTTTAFASSLKSSSLLNLPKVNSSLGTSASAVMLSPRDTPSTSPNRKDAAQETLKRSATSSVEHAELNSPLDMSQRIDFFVQESLIDNNVHQFLLGLKSHFSYWWNKDIHHFIVKNLVQSPSSSSSSLEEGVDVAVKVNAKADSFSL